MGIRRGTSSPPLPGQSFFPIDPNIPSSKVVCASPPGLPGSLLDSTGRNLNRIHFAVESSSNVSTPTNRHRSQSAGSRGQALKECHRIPRFLACLTPPQHLIHINHITPRPSIRSIKLRQSPLRIVKGSLFIGLPAIDTDLTPYLSSRSKPLAYPFKTS